MAAEETLKIVLRFSFGERFSRFERLYKSGAALKRFVEDCQIQQALEKIVDVFKGMFSEF